MFRFVLAAALSLWSLPLLAQDNVCYFQKCYGSGTVLITTVPSTAGMVEVAVRNMLCPTEPPGDPLVGKLVFRTVIPVPDPRKPGTPVRVVMHDVDKYSMENPFTAAFAGPATVYMGLTHRGIKGTLEVQISDRRDPTDELGPGIMQFDTISMTFVPATSPLPYQLSWQGIVWRGDLVVFERWGR